MSDKMVAVYWRDSHQQQPIWVDRADVEPTDDLIVSVGFLERGGPIWTTIYMSNQGDTEPIGAVVHIPTRCIEKVVELCLDPVPLSVSFGPDVPA